MLTDSQVTTGLNMGLHIVLLFAFLTVLFFMVISKVESKTSGNAVLKIIKKETGNVLSNMDKWSTIVSPSTTINWQSIDKMAKKKVTELQGKDPEIVKSNNSLQTNSIIIAVVLFLLWVGFLLFFVFYQKRNINVKEIIIDNLVIFSFIGIIEYLFFTRIISNYIPVTPDYAASSLIDRIKERVNESFDQ